MNDTKKKAMKTAEYYLNLNYPVSLRKLAPEEGGGYTAAIPLLGGKTFVADGETVGEALENLEELKQQLIPVLLQRGEQLPEPESETLEQFSGSLMLRVPKTLHARLVAEAKRNQTSINKLATQFLAMGLGEQTVLAEVEARMSALIEEIKQTVKEEPPAAYPSAHKLWIINTEEPTEQDIPADYKAA